MLSKGMMNHKRKRENENNLKSEESNENNFNIGMEDMAYMAFLNSKFKEIESKDSFINPREIRKHIEYLWDNSNEKEIYLQKGKENYQSFIEQMENKNLKTKKKNEKKKTKEETKEIQKKIPFFNVIKEDKKEKENNLKPNERKELRKGTKSNKKISKTDGPQEEEFSCTVDIYPNEEDFGSNVKTNN